MAQKKPVMKNDPLAWVDELTQEAGGEDTDTADTAASASAEVAATTPEPEPQAVEAVAAEAVAADSDDSAAEPVDADAAAAPVDGPIAISGRLTIAEVAGLHETLKAAVAASNELEIDLSAVEKIDTAGLQLLVAAQQTVTGNGGNIKWTSNNTVAESARTLGVQDMLGGSNEN